MPDPGCLQGLGHAEAVPPRLPREAGGQARRGAVLSDPGRPAAFAATSGLELLQVAWADALETYSTNPAPDGWLPMVPAHAAMLRELRERARAARVPDIGAMIAAGQDVRFWSDPHLGHKGTIAMSGRTPFATVADMDAHLLGKFDEACAEADLVVCLGDLGRGGTLPLHRELRRRSGGKHLLLIGNHDAKGTGATAWAREGALGSLAFAVPASLVASWFPQGRDLAAAPGSVRFGCSHWPVAQHLLPDASWINLHGHIHQRQASGSAVNLCVEATGYKPVRLRDALTWEVARPALANAR